MPEEQASQAGKEQAPAGKTQAQKIDELMDYLKKGGSLGLEIEKKLEELPEKYSALFVTRREKNNLIIANLIKAFCKKGMPGIFVTLNKSAEDLAKVAQEQDIPCEALFIVDAVSRKEAKYLENSEAVSYVESPQDLTEIEAEVADFITRMPDGEKFFILDSISTLLIYNSEKSVEKFVHKLGERLRSSNFKSVFVVMEGTNQEILNVLSQFCDHIIRPSPVISGRT